MKETKISDIIAAIMDLSNSDELCERFYAAYENRDVDDFYGSEDFGMNMMKAIQANTVDWAFYAFCGTSAEDILKKGLFIPDDGRKFYDEFEDEEVEILFGDKTKKTVSCKLNTDSHELFAFELDDEDKEKEISEITFKFCCKDFEVYPKSEMYANDKWSFWYADEKWRK